VRLNVSLPQLSLRRAAACATGGRNVCRRAARGAPNSVNAASHAPPHPGSDYDLATSFYEFGWCVASLSLRAVLPARHRVTRKNTRVLPPLVLCCLSFLRGEAAELTRDTPFPSAFLFALWLPGETRSTLRTGSRTSR
jgi:hypothetical protein